MADFRRWMTALAIMALFVSLAFAQGGVGTPGSSGTSPLTCAVNTTVTPTVRQEGLTELVGDILITCTGGSPVAFGSPVPTVNITLFLNVPNITSRLLNTNNGTTDALLMVDEPGSGEAGYGPGLPQIYCGNATVGAGVGGCSQQVGTVTTTNTTLGTNGVVSNVAVSTAATSTPGANVFSGVLVNNNQLNFFGVPVLPPVSSGISRIFRITNVRINANTAGSGVAGGPGQVTSSISVSPPSGMPISNLNPVVAFIASSLAPSVSSAQGFAQCNQTGKNNAAVFAGILNYTENFPTAFKTRVDGQKASGASGFTSTVTQNVPGTAYNSESGFIANGAGTNTFLSPAVANSTVSGGGFTAGLADYGTRLKAQFFNVPSGVVLYVSTTNIFGNSSTFAPPIAASTTPTTASPLGVTTATSYAVLLSTGSESASDSTGTLPLSAVTTSFSSSSPLGGLGTNIAAITSTGSTIVVVWEVINTQPTVNETMSFAYALGYSGVTQTFPPAPTTGGVTLTYAPTPTNGAFSASSGGTTAVNTMIPRFADTSTGASKSFTINLCSTVLLFPYVTTVTGFDTGIVIANTTTDPFGTTPQAGTCALNWFQGGTAGNPAVTTTPVVATGTIFVSLSSPSNMAGQGFSGYMIAQCNFQLAHGVAEVMDVGLQHLLSAYEALVVTTGTGSRNIGTGGPENLNN